MNKKFSTLVAGMLLATTVGTVSAQDAANYSKSAAPSTLEAVTKVTDGRVYQLSDGYKVLVMKKIADGQGGYRFELGFVPYYEATIGESLWYVKQEKSNNENGIAFQFVNLAYNYPISFDPSKAQKYTTSSQLVASNLGGEAVNWSWMRSAEGDNLQIARTPEAYISQDSVMTIVPLDGGKVAAVKYATKDQADKLDELRLKPYVAGPVWLNKYDLNSMLQTQDESNVIFSFAKGATEPNLWDKKPYEAVDAVGKNTLAHGEVADAKAKADEAYEAYKVKDEELTSAIAHLEYAKEDVKKLADQKRDVRKQLTAKNKEIADQKGVVNMNRLFLSSALKSYEIYNESAVNHSDATDADKKALFDANKVLGAANEAYEQAEKNSNEFQALWDQVEENIVSANDAKANKQDELDIATKKQSIVSGIIKTISDKPSEYHYWLYNFYDEEGKGKADLYKKLLSALSIDKDSEDAKFVYEYGADLGNYLVEKGLKDKDFIDVQIDEFETQSADYSDDLAKDITTLTGELADLTTQYDALVGQESLLESQKLNIAQALANARKAQKDAQKAYDELENSIAYNSERAQYYKKLADAAKQDISLYEADLETAKNALAQLRDEKSSLLKDFKAVSLQLRDQKLTAYWAWIAVLKTDEEAAAAARNYQNLYAVYAKLNEIKTPYWLSLKAGEDAKGNNLYMMVDTAYLEKEVAGIQHLAFATRTHKADFENANAPLAARDVNGRFNFRFLYWPTQDSLHIEADGFNQKNVTTANWADRTDDEITLTASLTPGNEQNLVKIAVLGGGRREATIGNSENLKGTNLYTINDRIGLKISPAEHDVTLAAGLYYMDVVNSANNQQNEARLMLDLDGRSLTKVAPAEFDVMDFAHMPAAKWVVTEKSSDFGGYPEILNQENAIILNNGAYKVLSNSADEAQVVLNYWYNYTSNSYILKSDTFKLSKAPSNTLGYYSEKPENVNFTLSYLNVNPGLSVTIGNSTVGNDTILRVSSDDATKFDLETLAVWTYGVPFDGDTLKQGVYRIRVNDPYKFSNDHKYVQVSNVGGTEMVTVGDAASASVFKLKEVNCVDGIHYYALLTSYPEGVAKKAGVIDASGLIKAENLVYESTTSAFALVADTTALYREFTADELGQDGAMKFYRVNSTEKAYLYEGADNLLCVEGKGDDKAEAFNVIPTGVENTLMPQYLIAKDVKFIAGDTVWCNATAAHKHETLADSLACSHTVITADTTFGRFLVNMIDSVPTVQKYVWEKKYTRLAFLPGYIADDKLTIEGTTKVVGLSKVNEHDATKFAFRLVNDDSNDFLIESESHGKTAFDGGIAPSANNGGWVKVQNGVPVIINDFEAAMQSDLYNVDTNEGKDPTANEDVTVSAVTVIAGEGQVTIAGAAGKKVVITNILGQTVANTVLSSDNVQIAAPQGVVVVAVEGEDAVKAIVK